MRETKWAARVGSEPKRPERVLRAYFESPILRRPESTRQGGRDSGHRSLRPSGGLAAPLESTRRPPAASRPARCPASSRPLLRPGRPRGGA